MSIPVPAILNEAVPATTQNVDAEIQASLRSANKYAGELTDNINTFISVADLRGFGWFA